MEATFSLEYFMGCRNFRRLNSCHLLCHREHKWASNLLHHTQILIYLKIREGESSAVLSRHLQYCSILGIAICTAPAPVPPSELESKLFFFSLFHEEIWWQNPDTSAFAGHQIENFCKYTSVQCTFNMWCTNFDRVALSQITQSHFSLRWSDDS